jgi:thioredoxin-dependent peroxiredoxin
MRNSFKVLVALLGLFPWCGITANAADVDLLYFYPKDKSSGCTIQAHEYQNALPKFEEHHAVVLGVSLDTAESHKSFCTQDGLTFKLLADPERQAATAYGVPLMTFKDMKFDERDTFLISPKGTIAEVWRKVDPQKDSSIVLGAIAGQGKH